MTRTLLHIATAAALATVALAGCKKNQDETATAPPPAATPEPAVTTPEPAAPAATTAPAAGSATVTSVQLGNAVGADMKVAAASATFAPTDTIYVSVDTRTADATATVPGKLTARWTYQDGQVVNEESRDLQLSGDGTTEFHISKPDGFPAGKYKVEVSLDGNVVQTKEFEVR